MKGDVRRRKLMSPMLLAPSLELPFFDRAVEDEACDTVYQRGNDSHLRNNRRTAKGSDRGVAKNGNIFFERAVGSLGSRSQGVQFTIPFSASGDFQNKARMLGNRDMRCIAKSIGSMRTVPVKLEIGWKIGLHTLHETGKRKPLSGRVKAVRPRGKIAIRDLRPAVAIITSFNESLADQLFIPGVAID